MRSYSEIIEFLSEVDRYKHPNRDKWEGVYYGMSLHIDGAQPSWIDMRTGRTVIPKNYYGERYQELFDTVLLNKYWREDEVIRQWRLSAYKPHQQDPFLRVIQQLQGTLFQQSNYSIEINDIEDYNYIWNRNFDGDNLIGYFKGKVTNIMEDPNGYFVVIPKEAGYDTTTERIEPRVLWVPSLDIVYASDSELIFKHNDIYWVVNKIGYLRFYKDERGVIYNIDGVDNTGTERGYFSHNLGSVPAFVAGGIWNTQGFYDSWLNAGKSWADSFVSEMSSFQMVNKEASYPYIIEADTECPECKGVGQKQVDCHDCPQGYELVHCSTCNGSGNIARTPGQRMIAPIDKMGDDLVKIINPNTGVNEFHLKNTDAIYKAIEKAIHLSFIDQAQSGEAKDRDMETRYQFYSTLADDIFGRLIDGVLRSVLGIRNVITEQGVSYPDFSGYSITVPTQFSIKTTSTLLEEYRAAKESGVPSFVVAKHIEDYVDKQYGNDEILKKKTLFINEYDIIALMSDDSKQIALLAGVITQRDWQYSIRLPLILDKLIRLRGEEWFIEAGMEDIDISAREIFNEMVPEPYVLSPYQEDSFNEANVITDDNTGIEG